MTITYSPELVQGSEEWAALRCGLLTASEMKLVLTPTLRSADGVDPSLASAAGELVRLAPAAYDKVRKAEAKRLGIRVATLDSEIKKLRATVAAPAEKVLAHVYELAAQRITGYVEPHYVSDDMLRGHEDEVEARIKYAERYAPVEECGFITNDRWGFTLGYSPDGLVGDDGLIEAKSRRQKFQIQTIVENVWTDRGETIPPDYVLQAQTGLLVSERKWVDFVSYSGGLPMATIRVYPNVEVQEAIIEAATAFEAKVAEVIENYHSALRSKARLIPTERRVEQEMIL